MTMALISDYNSERGDRKMDEILASLEKKWAHEWEKELQEHLLQALSLADTEIGEAGARLEALRGEVEKRYKRIDGLRRAIAILTED